MTTQNSVASAPARSPTEFPGDLIIFATQHGITEYRGKRAALEAEGVIPARTKWPDGYTDLSWNDGRFSYWLYRNRPPGAKGPRKDFIDVDWWHLRWTPNDAPSMAVRELRQKKKELVDFAYCHTAQGQAALSKEWNRIWAAKTDKGFQAFKASIPGLIPPKRGRKPIQSQGGAA